MYAEEGERDGCTRRPAFFPRYGGGVGSNIVKTKVECMVPTSGSFTSGSLCDFGVFLRTSHKPSTRAMMSTPKSHVSDTLSMHDGTQIHGIICASIYALDPPPAFFAMERHVQVERARKPVDLAETPGGGAG